MRKTIVAIASVITFLTTNHVGFSQQSTDAKFLFKMWFFIEHINQHSRTETDFLKKDSSLFSLFTSVIDLRLDTLKSEGFDINYSFFSVSPLKNNNRFSDSAVTYDSGTKYLGYVSIPVNNCDGYVLCVNILTGRSYRLQGFYGNDFIKLLQEIKEEYQKSKDKRLSTKKFIKNYFVTSIDLNCLYNGLSAAESEKKSYPCLKSCSDYVIITH